MSNTIMAIDQGTTGTTVLLVNKAGQVVARGYQEFPQIYPQAGWVEHDPEAIWHSTVVAMERALEAASLTGTDVAAIGITNQRETTLVWERATLKPIYNAIVWQCRRTADRCAALKAQGHEEMFRSRTGLVLDPYFSGTKLAWILDEVAGARSRARNGELAFGTVDTYLVARLCGPEVHVTDVSNASRTLLMDLRTRAWDRDLMAALNVPGEMLPRIVSNAEVMGKTKNVPGLPDGIPVAGMAGDQQAALFGQVCFAPGEAKCTYGTGAFMLTNIGNQPLASTHGLLTTVAWDLDGEVSYAFEGSAFIAGAAVQWLRDGLEFFPSAPDIEPLARSVPDSGGVTCVPALTGLGAPHWRPDARGAILGITRGTTRAHIARAVLEGIALQNRDIMNAMAEDLGEPLAVVRVDGGAAANDLLMQLQADLLATRILRPTMLETTGFGAAFLAGLGIGFWEDRATLRAVWQLDREFVPDAEAPVADMLARWEAAVRKA